MSTYFQTELNTNQSINQTTALILKPEAQMSLNRSPGHSCIGWDQAI
jgi:hypothetical protein